MDVTTEAFVEIVEIDGEIVIEDEVVVAIVVYVVTEVLESCFIIEKLFIQSEWKSILFI